MKVLTTKKAGLIIRSVLCACFITIVLINILGVLFDLRYFSVFAAAGDADRFEIKNRLLMEAMDGVGVCSPHEAAEVWANGLKTRSAARQYSVMSADLKEQYARQLETSAPNWVTGVSSPWIKSYRLEQNEPAGTNRTDISLLFSTETSSGPAEEYKAILTIVREGEFWRIAEIKADRGLYPYMGISPEQDVIF